MSCDTPALDYRPIREAVRARLVSEDRDWHSVTETCRVLAVIAHEQHETWCQQPSSLLHGTDPRGALRVMAQLWAPEIAAIRQVSALVTASLTGAGWSTADVERAIERKLALELLLAPPAAMN